MVRVTPAIARIKSSPVWSLVVATARLERGRHVALTASPLNTADIRLLWLLSSEGPRTMKEISDALGLEQSTVNRQVNAALKHGLVERVDRAGDANSSPRARPVRATREGERVFVRDLNAGMAVFEVALKALPEDEREQFMANSLAFAQAYQVEAAAAAARLRG